MPTILRGGALAVLCAFALWGCASTQLSGDADRNIRNVAVVSLVPEKANFEKIGLTVFNNERAEIDLGARITSTVQSVATKRISVARPKWSIKEITYDRAALIAQMKQPGLVISYSEEKIQNVLAELSRKNGLDALFVISSYRSQNSPGDGVGVLLSTISLSSISSATVHSNISLKVVGSTGKVIAVPFGLPEQPKRLDPEALGIVYELKNNLRPELVNRLSDEIIEHLTKSLDKRFDQLGL